MLALRSSNGLKFRISGKFGRSAWVLMDENQQGLTHVAFLLTDLEVHEAWLAYFAYGGNQRLWAVDAYLNELIPLPVHDCDLLAVVLNERLSELHLPHLLSYSG